MDIDKLISNAELYLEKFNQANKDETILIGDNYYRFELEGKYLMNLLGKKLLSENLEANSRNRISVVYRSIDEMINS
jgi:hypothetical protein